MPSQGTDKIVIFHPPKTCSNVVNVRKNFCRYKLIKLSLSSAKRLSKAELKMTSKGLLITRSNIHQLNSDDILSFNSKEYWHKFILENGGLFDKEAILEAVLDSIAPFDLIPVKFTVEGKDAYFLARNCGQAIEKFCLNLLLPIQLKDPPGEVILSIQTCSVPIDQYKMNMQFHLKNAIEKRYDDTQKGFIDLSCFHKEPELYDVLFCPLSKPRILVYVLSILKRILTVTSINLSNNGIEILKPLEILHEFEGLVSLDLSYNKIKDPNLAEFLGKTTPALHSLNLTGNPLCSLFKTEIEYLTWIRDKIHLIENLDGVLINYGYPNQQVYLCSESAWGIVNEFLRHYFTLYDDNRQALEHIYDKNAMFSMTCDHIPSESYKDSKLECYKHESKNLLKVSDENKIMGICHQKNTVIADVLWKLPLTEHDPHSFKVDLIFFEEAFIVLVVSGLFKDFQESPRIRSFNRTFALKKVANYEFKITNDLYHVTNASADEINGSFLFKKPQNEKAVSEVLVTKEEEDNLIEVVSRLTKMNPVYSRCCLKDCSWDVKKALEVFLENYEIFNIPPEAFYDELPL